MAVAVYTPAGGADVKSQGVESEECCSVLHAEQRTLQTSGGFLLELLCEQLLGKHFGCTQFGCTQFGCTQFLCTQFL